MRHRARASVLVLVCGLLALAAAYAGTQPRISSVGITTPEQQFGAAIGDDFFLASYTQLEAYWKQLDRESDRLSLVDIGRTEEGRTQWMAVITAPENFDRIERYRDASRRLALGEGLTDAGARALAAAGRAVVWIDGGLHATETLGAQQLIETVYQLVSGHDAETERVLRNVIVLAVHANPDGHELVADWYMRRSNPRERTLHDVPRLYQKYAGHDNNRDFYIATQAETANMSRVLYQDWFPQIVLNHHQSALADAVMFAPPFSGPFNYVLDPLVPAGIELAGAAIHARFAAEGKPGVTMRSGSPYSLWWNGGLRTTAYFHNQIGLLTEIVGGPTPMTVPLAGGRREPHADLPFPIERQEWRFRQAIDYAVTANRAVLDIASRYREQWLFNAYRMARNSIDRGSRDSWTERPHRPRREPDPRHRDPRGYIIPADQPDFLTATKFVNALLTSGVTVHHATADFTVDGRTYPGDSFVVKTAQAFRPHVLDMFEPQDHPDEFQHAGGAPRPPYDSAGWTLAFQMGVKFDRVQDAFDGPFERVVGSARPPRGAVTGSRGAAGYVVSHSQNDAAIVVNRLLKAGEPVFWLNGRTIYVSSSPSTEAILAEASDAFGLTFEGVSEPPARDARQLRPARVALVDRYGGWSSSGWLRWILERFEFSFDVVYPPALADRALTSRYDVIVLPGEAVPADPRSSNLPPPAAVPDEYRDRIGEITAAVTVPALRQFVENGGILLAIGQAAAIGSSLGLPLTNALLEQRPDGSLLPLRPERLFVPGSIVRVAVDTLAPLASGFEGELDVFFDNSPVFRLDAGASALGIRPVAWFDTAAPLRSGWAWGQSYLKDTVAVVDAPLGRGRVLLFGPEITFRAQPHGTFKFLFNGIHHANSVAVRLGTGSQPRDRR